MTSFGQDAFKNGKYVHILKLNIIHVHKPQAIYM